MTREGFAANNRGIAAGGNLEESFLNEIFDHIRANPISLKEDDQAREKGETQVGKHDTRPVGLHNSICIRSAIFSGTNLSPFVFICRGSSPI